MRVSNVVQISGGVIAAFLLAGCANGPTRPVPDSTPSWMTYEVSGSRIKRRVDPNGDAGSASFVTRTNAKNLALMPGVAVKSIY